MERRGRRGRHAGEGRGKKESESTVGNREGKEEQGAQQDGIETVGVPSHTANRPPLTVHLDERGGRGER